MKEVKEILDKLKSNNYPFGIATIDINKLEDYITILQEENEKYKIINELQYKVIQNSKEYITGYVIFQSIINKAIEYINTHYLNANEPELLNILKGEDE